MRIYYIHFAFAYILPACEYNKHARNKVHIIHRLPLRVECFSLFCFILYVDHSNTSRADMFPQNSIWFCAHSPRHTHAYSKDTQTHIILKCPGHTNTPTTALHNRIACASHTTHLCKHTHTHTQRHTPYVCKYGRIPHAHSLTHITTLSSPRPAFCRHSGTVRPSFDTNTA